MATRRKRGSKWAKWLAVWAANRRRRRFSLGNCPAAPLSNLMQGLVQFYVPVAGDTHLRSWNETETLTADPYAGLSFPGAEEAQGYYYMGDYVQYTVYAFRDSGAGRKYAGRSGFVTTYVGVEDAGIRWAGFDGGDWASGYLVARYYQGAMSAMVIPASVMSLGWIDVNSGWGPLAEIPVSFGAPPGVVRAVWVETGSVQTEPIDTVAGMFGGVAFNSGLGQRLVREMSDDLRRELDGTLAFWVQPTNGTSGSLIAVRGYSGVKWQAAYNAAAPNLSVGPGAQPIVTDHQSSDWYLVVMRNDTLTDSAKLDMVRVRDGARFSRTEALGSTYEALSWGDDYWREGMQAVLDVGEGGLGGVRGDAYFDRIGIWERPLTDDEVEELYNGGLGWKP